MSKTFETIHQLYGCTIENHYTHSETTLKKKS